MGNLIKVANENDVEYARKFLKGSLENVYIIKREATNIGIVEYREKEDYVKIDLIEIEEKFRRQGVAQKVIQNFLLYSDVVGDSLPESVEFWSSLDAEFEEDVEECAEIGSCIPFTIYR